MWIGLTGETEISGVLYGDLDEVEGRLVPEPTIWEGRGGAEIVLDERLRPEGALSWQTLDASTHYTLMRVTAGQFDLRLRTERAGDPGPGSARIVRVRRVSPVELTTPNTRRSSSTGQLLYSARIEWRAVRPEAASVWLPTTSGSQVQVDSAVAGTVYAARTD